MATFNRHYLTSELLDLLKRGSLTPYYWSFNDGLYTFYFLDNRRSPRLQSNGTCYFSSHRSNYYRLRNKINALPFRLLLDYRSLSSNPNCFLYNIVPDSVFLNEGSSEKLNHLNELFDGKLIVNVVVI